MDHDMKKRWVDALRSGEYEQGYENYYKDDKYCPLGILVKLQGCPLRDFENPPRHFFMELSFYVWSRIIHLNDGDKLTFDQIADWIEINL